MRGHGVVRGCIEWQRSRVSTQCRPGTGLVNIANATRTTCNCRCVKCRYSRDRESADSKTSGKKGAPRGPLQPFKDAPSRLS